MADGASKSGTKAPSFYSAAADMQMGAKPAAGTPVSADNSAERTKIVSTLLEVLDKWDKMEADPKIKSKIQQIATLTKEIQSGMAGAGAGPDGKPMASESTTPAPDAMAGGGAGAGGGGPVGVGAGAGAAA